MGSDDLFHKRRKKAEKSLKRSQAKRDAYDRVLIVCEGEKTEPHYLQELIDHLKLNSANVLVDGRSSSSPDKVWQYAKERYREAERRGDVFDRVYCVIDRDSHTTFDQTLVEIRKSRPNGVFHATPSVPCFEYWVLLHFDYKTAPYTRTGSNSPCDCVIADLKRYMPGYTKGDKGVFYQIMSDTDRAIALSKLTLAEAHKTGTDNPTTLMHELVDYLRHLKNGTRS
ncbi:RloB family protein [Sedimenticola hydrogenitrophicus]|uniref:RloB family protein n=1 Tax=Sedimenticola hydrogenitrophicus TaxID=2967975 RepID=UPI0023B0FFCA|nr:RloB family protein [Sedimenticola hydrogenitrophicus]